MTNYKSFYFLIELFACDENFLRKSFAALYLGLPQRFTTTHVVLIWGNLQLLAHSLSIASITSVAFLANHSAPTWSNLRSKKEKSEI